MKLLTRADGNAKTAKDSERFEAAILHLSPAATADGIHTVCPWATRGCAAACLNTAGRAQFRGELIPGKLPGGIHAARRERTLLYLRDRAAFLRQLRRELTNLQRRADKRGVKAVVRLNGTSDIPWETVDPTLFADFPRIQFYDYTKGLQRAHRLMASTYGQLIPNYHVTLSYSERLTLADVRYAQRCGIGVAVVFADDETAMRRALEFMPPTATLIERFAAPPKSTSKLPLPITVDGLASDWRFEDPRGALVVLTAKGRAKHDATGFVVR